MSFDTIKWAINQDIDDPKEKLLLVVLSDFLNDKSRQCNPSRETLMRKACIKNNKTLSSKLDSLVSRGLIEIVRGKGVSNHYLVQNRTTFSTEPSSAVNHVQQCTTTQFNTEPTPSSAVNHEPISEPIKEPINNSIESAPNFSLTAPEKTTISKKETVEKKPKRPKKEKVPCPYNEDGPIPEEFLKIAQKHNIQDPQQLFSKMVAYCKANGKQYADYKAAFTTWCLNESKWQQQKPPNQTSKSFAYEPPGGFTDEFYMKGCKFDKNGNLIL